MRQVKENLKEIKSKPAGLLFILFLFSILSCKSDKENDIKIVNEDYIHGQKEMDRDSIDLTIIFDKKGKTGVNITDSYLEGYFESFVNPSESGDTIKRKIYSTHLKQIFYFGTITLENAKYKFKERGFLVNKKFPNVNATYRNSELNLIYSSKTLDLSILYDEYKEISIEVDEDNEKIIKSLNDVFLGMKNKFAGNDSLLEVNELFYYSKLSQIHPFNDKLENYILNLESPIYSKELRTILFFYVKNRIDSLKFSDLNSSNFSENFLNLLSKGVYAFLSYEDNRGDQQYQSAMDWLKTTDLYKKDSVFVKRKIAQIDNSSFRTSFKKLSVLNLKGLEFNFKQIVKENPSNYYIVDFWATWCAPCIEGAKIIKKMNIPKNVKVISISIDNEKNIQKWIEVTNKLEQSISYRLDVSSDEYRNFATFMEMQSVPRYILIDRELNLIDQAFYHPQEPQFLSKLEDVDNNKYW